MDDIKNSFPERTRPYFSLTFVIWDGCFPFSKVATKSHPTLDSLVIAKIRSTSIEYVFLTKGNLHERLPTTILRKYPPLWFNQSAA